MVSTNYSFVNYISKFFRYNFHETNSTLSSFPHRTNTTVTITTRPLFRFIDDYFYEDGIFFNETSVKDPVPLQSTISIYMNDDADEYLRESDTFFAYKPNPSIVGIEKTATIMRYTTNWKYD